MGAQGIEGVLGNHQLFVGRNDVAGDPRAFARDAWGARGVCLCIELEPEPSEALDMGPMGKYQMFNRPHGMIGGMMNKPPEMAHVPPNWQIYFRVPDIAAAVERIKANGGQILNGPMEVPGGDWVVNAMDPQGAAFALHARKAG